MQGSNQTVWEGIPAAKISRLLLLLLTLLVVPPLGPGLSLTADAASPDGESPAAEDDTERRLAELEDLVATLSSEIERLRQASRITRKRITSAWACVYPRIMPRQRCLAVRASVARRSRSQSWCRLDLAFKCV